MKKRHHVAQQILKEQQYQKDNGPIVKTADQLWKYSGEIEKDSENYTNLILETKTIKLPAKQDLIAKRYKSRKKYFKLYWLKQKQKINEKNNNKDEHK